MQRTVLLGIAIMDHLIHHSNPVATATVRTNPDAIWVGLNSDTTLIPDAAIAFKDLPDPCWSVKDFSDSRRILPIDSTRDPDWYREDEQWAAWTPTSFLPPETKAMVRLASDSGPRRGESGWLVNGRAPTASLHHGPDLSSELHPLHS